MKRFLVTLSASVGLFVWANMVMAQSWIPYIMGPGQQVLTDIYNSAERAAMAAADELVSRNLVEDQTFAALKKHLNPQTQPYQTNFSGRCLSHLKPTVVLGSGQSMPTG